MSKEPELPASETPEENKGSTINRQNAPADEDSVLMAHELANNDGSILETLDTAFHGEPGMIKAHSLAGSSRADYYEARSQGKSDSEEELEYLRNKNNKADNAESQ